MILRGAWIMASQAFHRDRNTMTTQSLIPSAPLTEPLFIERLWNL